MITVKKSEESDDIAINSIENAFIKKDRNFQLVILILKKV